MTLIHWNYFLALEDDLDKLSRFIEFHTDNFKSYSIENARILMLATQEVDVLMKDLCSHHGQPCDNEQDYRGYLPTKYPRFTDVPMSIPKYNLDIRPFKEWDNNTTPTWWTANNKIKHLRSTEFYRASLENALSAMAALLVTAIYFYSEVKSETKLPPNPKLFYPGALIKGITPTAMGNLNLYEIR